MRTRILTCAAIMTAASITLCGTAKADDDDTDDPGPHPSVVCGMYDAGIPPGDIAGDLRRNQPRVNSPTLPYRVFQQIQDCP